MIIKCSCYTMIITQMAWLDLRTSGRNSLEFQTNKIISRNDFDSCTSHLIASNDDHPHNDPSDRETHQKSYPIIRKPSSPTRMVSVLLKMMSDTHDDDDWSVCDITWDQPLRLLKEFYLSLSLTVTINNFITRNKKEKKITMPSHHIASHNHHYQACHSSWRVFFPFFLWEGKH